MADGRTTLMIPSWLDENRPPLLEEDPPDTEVPAFFDPWADPTPPEFPGGVLSRPMEDSVFAAAIRDGVCPGALAMAYLAGTSGAANKSIRFKPYANVPWFVPPILWVMMIADSGQRKTPIQALAFAGLRSAHSEIWRHYRDASRQWQRLSKDDQRQTPKPEEPHSLIVEDVTPEKLQMILAATDRGTFMLRDEIAGFLEFGRYTPGKGDSARAFYLQAYEGDGYTVSRLTRESIYIDVNAVTIFGSIQPDRLADFPDLAKDGLVQRFNMIRASRSSVSRDDVVVKGLDRINDAITKLTQMDARDYYTTPEGAAAIRETERFGQSLAAIPDYGPGFSGACSKLHGTHARYALILHLLDDPDQECIPTATVARAGILAREFLLPQARNFFGGLAGSPVQKTQDIASWLLTKAKPKFTASDLSSGLWSCRNLTGKDIYDALDRFVMGKWIKPAANYPSNRTWMIHPLLRTSMPERTESERIRREELRQLVASIGKPKP